MCVWWKLDSTISGPEDSVWSLDLESKLRASCWCLKQKNKLPSKPAADTVYNRRTFSAVRPLQVFHSQIRAGFIRSPQRTQKHRSTDQVKPCVPIFLTLDCAPAHLLYIKPLFLKWLRTTRSFLDWRLLISINRFWILEDLGVGGLLVSVSSLALVAWR